jgi:hypothetical protein
VQAVPGVRTALPLHDGLIVVAQVGQDRLREAAKVPGARSTATLVAPDSSRDSDDA